MTPAEHYLGLVKLAEAAAARTASSVARNYWTKVAEKNRQLAAEALTHMSAMPRPKQSGHPASQ